MIKKNNKNTQSKTKLSPKKKKFGLFRLLPKYCKPYALSLLIIVLLQTAQAILNLYLPTLNADIITKGVAKGDVHYISVMGWWMVLIGCLQMISSVISVFFAARVAMGVGRDLRRDLFTKVNDFSQREVGKFGVPSLITRTTNDVQQVQMILLMFLTLIISAPITMISGIVLTLRHDLYVSSLLLISIPILCGVIGVFAAILVGVFRKVQKNIDKMNRVLREQLAGIRIIRAFTRDSYEQVRFAKVNQKQKDYLTTAGRFFSFVFPIVMLIVNLTNTGVIYLSSHQIDQGKMEIGSLTAITSYILQILTSIMIAAMLMFMLPRAQVSAGRIGSVLNTVSTISPKHPSNSQANGKITEPGKIELVNAGFRYSGATDPVLKDINFSVNLGETVAIIGSTGSGKSTLINLISRLFDATQGSVKVGGENVKNLKLETLWHQVGLIPQKAYLFGGTIASNMRFGNKDATDKEIWNALEIAQAKDFVAKLPEGLNSQVAQGGTNFSGGQKQRLAIARAILLNPSIYLFDDSFSALDFAVDAALRAALKPVTKNASVLIVAQRVGTIIDASKILVLDKGTIVGSGTHSQLMKSCEVYKEIVYSQLSKEEVESLSSDSNQNKSSILDQEVNSQKEVQND